MHFESCNVGQEACHVVAVTIARISVGSAADSALEAWWGYRNRIEFGTLSGCRTVAAAAGEGAC